MSVEIGSVEIAGDDLRYQWQVLSGEHAELCAAIKTAVGNRRALFVVDGGFARHHWASLAPTLIPALSAHDAFVVAGGEKIKTLRMAEKLAGWMLDCGADRQTVVVTIGGGATSDLAGFAASMVMRGIAVIHCPTTLLAMADAALGGKTGVNTRHGKNTIGAFHQPNAVIAWTGALASLPARAFRSGLSEVVKSALLTGEEAMSGLEASMQAIVGRDQTAIRQALVMSCGLKAGIVSADAREGSVRKYLNLGHTLGHVWEWNCRSPRLTHGEAIARGLVCELALGEELGFVGSGLAARTRTLLEGAGFNCAPLPLSEGVWAAGLAADKKRNAGNVDLIALSAPGAAAIRPLLIKDLIEWLTSAMLVYQQDRLSPVVDPRRR
jgi:3-dehydroquinate synthetase